MKTLYLSLPLMTPMQINKEVLYNQSISKIDSLVPNFVIDILEQLPAHNNEEGEKYLIMDGEHKNQICYYINNTWEFLDPKKGMFLFVLQQKSFVYFSGDTWEKI